MRAGSFVLGVKPKITKCTAAAFCCSCRFENCEVAADGGCGDLCLLKNLGWY